MGTSRNHLGASVLKPVIQRRLQNQADVLQRLRDCMSQLQLVRGRVQLLIGDLDSGTAFSGSRFLTLICEFD